jgi:transcriptional regulator with XRE-family HTH domain
MALEVTGAAHLKDWMQRRQLRTQRELAQYLDTDERLISMVMNGHRGPGLRTALKIERLTGIPVEVWESSPVDTSEIADPESDGKSKFRKV